MLGMGPQPASHARRRKVTDANPVGSAVGGRICKVARAQPGSTTRFADIGADVFAADRIATGSAVPVDAKIAYTGPQRP